MATRCEELTHWKRPSCWERLKVGGEGDDGGERVGWHHQLNGHQFEQALGVGDVQGSMACYSPWGRKVSDRIERLNWTGLYGNFLLLPSLFHFFYFIFSASISFSLCFLIYVFLIFVVLSQAFIKCSRKASVYIYINSVYNVYILENVWISDSLKNLWNFHATCLTKHE